MPNSVDPPGLSCFIAAFPKIRVEVHGDSIIVAPRQTITSGEKHIAEQENIYECNTVQESETSSAHADSLRNIVTRVQQPDTDIEDRGEGEGFLHGEYDDGTPSSDPGGSAGQEHNYTGNCTTGGTLVGCAETAGEETQTSADQITLKEYEDNKTKLWLDRDKYELGSFYQRVALGSEAIPTGGGVSIAGFGASVSFDTSLSKQEMYNLGQKLKDESYLYVYQDDSHEMYVRPTDKIIYRIEDGVQVIGGVTTDAEDDGEADTTETVSSSSSTSRQARPPFKSPAYLGHF